MMTLCSDRIVHVFCRMGDDKAGAMMTHRDVKCERIDTRTHVDRKMRCKSRRSQNGIFGR
jgi:hypothetical protein